MTKHLNSSQEDRARACEAFENDLHSSLRSEFYFLGDPSNGAPLLVNQGYELWKAILNKHYPIPKHGGLISFKKSSIYGLGYQLLESFIDNDVCSDLRQLLILSSDSTEVEAVGGVAELAESAQQAIARSLFGWQNYYLDEKVCLVPRSIYFDSVPAGKGFESDLWHFDFEQQYDSLLFMVHLNNSDAGTFVLNSSASLVLASGSDYLGLDPHRRVSSLTEISNSPGISPLFVPAAAPTTIVFQPGRILHRHLMSNSSNKETLNIYASVVPKDFLGGSDFPSSHVINTIYDMINCVNQAMRVEHCSRHQPFIYS